MASPPPPPQHTDSQTDVLIIGAGPAGLMASMYLSELGIGHRIIDAKGTRTLNGRADGFHARTIEIWESFGMAERLRRYGCEFGEMAIWGFDKSEDVEEEVEGEDGKKKKKKKKKKGGILRYSRRDVAGEKNGLMHQGFIEAAFIEAARQRGGPRVERGTKPTAIEVGDYGVVTEIRRATMGELEAPRTGAHRVLEDGSLQAERGYIDCYGTDADEIVQHVSGEEGSTETIRAKYVIGSDGAHSWVRHQLPDFRMEGDNLDAVFGVLDIIPLTDFPDIRMTCSILSRQGFILVVPREFGMVRLYVQLPDDYSKTAKDRDDKAICAEILDAARKSLAPYTMDYKYCDWWTIYRIGQRVANHCSYQDRVFLAGDAIHTHSPKGGQGQNVSQQDTYNLSWKLAGVLRNQLSPAVLSTYETERIPVARELISLDRDMARVLTARANGDEAEAQRVYSRAMKTNGNHLIYEPNLFIASPDTSAHQQAAPGLPIGTRLAGTPIFNQSNGAPNNSQSLLKSNGLWRLCVFAGDVSRNPSHLSRINALGDRIASLAQRYPSASAKHSKWLQVLLFHSASVHDVEIAAFHDAFFPPDPVTGRDYFTLFGDRLEDRAAGGGGGAKEGTHAVYQVDAERGAMALVRPDQVVSWVGYADPEDLGMLEDFLRGFMIPPVQVGGGETERSDSPQAK
ncbi:phenol 2-monooxygenase [Lecanosticta acicola]|uniref:Phenol 2-monooxygenase n=1 Tax=Lecanosticta acicola TaxID=111012 RepID=A0AAI9EBR9_9PEZI|nr:phenol 2-monooxygenase [Lecanosticta acicola]